MKVSTIILIIIAVLIIACVVLYFFGKKAMDKQQEQQRMLESAAQSANILVIDKAKMKISEANFPSVVLENTPKRYRRAKVYVVKAKIGPKIMSLMCDETIYDQIPVKKEIKATISGIYITSVKGIRGPLDVPKKKKGFMAKLKETANNANAKK